MTTPIIPRQDVVSRQAANERVEMEAARRRVNEELKKAVDLPIIFANDKVSTSNRVFLAILEELKTAGWKTNLDEKPGWLYLS